MAGAAGPGRPRDRRIDDKALAAARELLLEKGFEGTTVQGVAERAGVHSSALYRRWPSRLQLIEEATYAGLAPIRVRPTGDLAGDLEAFVRAYHDVFADPVVRAAAPGLLAARHAPEQAPGMAAYLGVSARPQFRALLDAAPPGSLDPAVDADDAFDLLLGAVLVRVLAHPATGRTRPIERTVELLLRVLRPT